MHPCLFTSILTQSSIKHNKTDTIICFQVGVFFEKTNTSTKSIILLLTVCKAIDIQNKSFKQSQSYRQHIAWWSNLHDRLYRIRSYLWSYFTTFKKLCYILPHLSKSRVRLNLFYFSQFLCHTGHHLSFHFWTY